MSDIKPEVQAIADGILALSPAGQLRLAADLIESRNLSVAKSIVDRIAGELALVTMVGRQVGMSAPTGSKAP